MGISSSKNLDPHLESERLEQEAEKNLSIKTIKLFSFIFKETQKAAYKGYKSCTFLFTLGEEKADNELQNVIIVKKRELVEIMWMDDARYRVFSLLQKHGMKIKEEFRIKRKERKDLFSKKNTQFVWYGPSRGVTCTWDSTKEKVRLAR